MEEKYAGLSGARRVFSRIGLALTVIMVITAGIQLVWAYVLPPVIGEDHWLYTSDWAMWIVSFVPLYLIGIPVGTLLIRRLPEEKGPRNTIGIKDFLLFLLMCLPLMYGGNIIGNLLSALLSGGTAQNQLMDYVMDDSPLRVIIIVIVAPIIEEFVFRKLIIDHSRQYGEKAAVFLSALTFGLFHNNLFQFFYAFAIGWIFGYVYLRYGRLRYSVLLHGIINFMGAVIAPWILSKVAWILENPDPSATEELLANMSGEQVSGFLIYMVYVVVLMVLSAAGVAALILKRKSFVFLPASQELPAGQKIKTIYGNIGMILFIAACLGMIVWALF